MRNEERKKERKREKEKEKKRAFLPGLTTCPQMRISDRVCSKTRSAACAAALRVTTGTRCAAHAASGLG